jgi:hypothetical protein
VKSVLKNSIKEYTEDAKKMKKYLINVKALESTCPQLSDSKSDKKGPTKKKMKKSKEDKENEKLKDAISQAIV